MRDKYSAEDMALSYAELEQRSKAAMALYFQEYYHKQWASLGLEVCRELGSLCCHDTASSPAGAIWNSFW